VARLGGGKGLDRDSEDGNRRCTKDAEQTDQPTPDFMPQADLTAFYPACDGDDNTGKTASATP
jgi:hypothetical protein